MILIWYFSIFFIYTIWRFCESQESLFSITLSFVLIEKMWWVKSREQIVSFLCSVSSYLFQPLLFAFLVLINIMTHIWLHKVIKNGGSKIKDLILNSRWLEPWEKLKILIFDFLIFFSSYVQFTAKISFLSLLLYNRQSLTKLQKLF